MASAWFLLSLSVAQWVGGHLCFEVSYFMEVHRQMNAAEKMLAAEVKEETGIERTTVRVLQEDEVTPRGNFYGDFVFSQQTEEETVYYVVGDETDVTTYQVVSNAPDQNDDATNSNHINLLKGLFKEFMIPESGMLDAISLKQPDSVFQFSAPCGFDFTPFFLHPPATARA